jgi:antitoxin HicB
MTRFDYPFMMHPLSEDEGGGYLIEFPDLPGCMSDGATPEEALRNGADAVQCWIAAMREAGRPIPGPSRAALSKRTIAVHDHVYRDLAEEASLQGLSVETIADAALLYGLGSLLERIESAPPVKSPPKRARARPAAAGSMPR